MLKRIGLDGYMLLLVAVMGIGVVVPAQGAGAAVLGQVTFWAVALLFFLYGAKLDSSAVVQGMMNWRLQLLTFLATFALFPVVGIAIAGVTGGMLGSALVMGVLFLSVLPSTVQSSVAFTAMAGGNVPAAICAASLSNLVGVVLTPALVAIVLSQEGGTVGVEAIIKIGTQILLPFAAGQILRPLIGAFIRRQKTLSMVVDRGSILLIVYSAFSAGTIAGIWSSIPPATLVILFGVISVYLAITMAMVEGAGHLFRLPEGDRTALLFCGSTKSLASGLPIATAIFAPEIVSAVILPLMMFHMLQLFVCAIIARRRAEAL